MATSIFVNLPVQDLQRSINFFTNLGYSFNQQFTDDKAGCLVISDTIYAMLLKHEYFKSFSNLEVADTSKANEVILCLSADDREGVDNLVDKALKAGGKEPRPAQDHGFMYSRAFNDPDGHQWEVVYMDPSAIQG